MIQNYFKIAYRSLLRNSSFSFINILGLAGGMAVCMFILTLIIDQNNFDTFHEHEDRIYRVTSQANADVYATTPFLVKQELVNNFSAIEEITSIRRAGGDLKFGEKVIPFEGLYSTPAFFELFDFEFQQGDKKTSLVEPYSIVLKEETAEKLGLNVADIGKSISINDWGGFKLTGILKKPAGKTHLKFDFLIAEATYKPLQLAEKINAEADSWNNNWHAYVYFLLKENANPKSISAELPALSKRIYADAERKLEFGLQPLTEISPSKIMNNELSITMPVMMLSFLSMLALLVLLTACFNYTNLSVAKSLTRVKEIGIRKVVGARRGSILIQFMAEAVLTALLAFVLAIVVLELIIMPQFLSLNMTRYFDFNGQISLSTYLLFLGFSVFVGLLAGIIPSVYLSAFKPLEVLKTTSSFKVFKRIGIRKVLMISQLVIAMVFFTTVVVLYQQTTLLMKADYGFNKENLINLSLQGNDFEKVKTILAEHKNITQISGTSIIPGTGRLQTRDVRLPDSSQLVNTCRIKIDENFIQNLDLKLVAGREFTNEDVEGETQVVINKKSVDRMGFSSPAEAVGQSVVIEYKDKQTEAQVIGVVDNFVHHFIANATQPLMLTYQPAEVETVNLRILPYEIPATLAFIEAQWAALDPIHPLDYRFFDDQLYEQISILDDAVKLIGFLALITIIITCMGLLGIANYTVQTREKEIGIRKVLGADLRRVMWTLSKGMIYPILIAVAISLPIVWLLNSLWLEEFAKRISLSVSNIGLGMLLLSILVVAIVLSQSLRVANKNPVKALRTE